MLSTQIASTHFLISLITVKENPWCLCRWCHVTHGSILQTSSNNKRILTTYMPPEFSPTFETKSACIGEEQQEFWVSPALTFDKIIRFRMWSLLKNYIKKVYKIIGERSFANKGSIVFITIKSLAIKHESYVTSSSSSRLRYCVISMLLISDVSDKYPFI
jgi:hypothetical protein